MALAAAALAGAASSLTSCDREPIHLPGLIQPHGFLLCLDAQTRRVVQASADTGTLLGHGLEMLLAPVPLAAVAALWPALAHAARLLGTRLGRAAGQPLYKLALHRHDGLLWVEGEPVASAAVSAFDLPALSLTLGHLLAADTVLGLCQGTAAQVRALTGFDRVAAYRFAEDGSGQVVAEAQRPDLGPWLGLHCPATEFLFRAFYPALSARAACGGRAGQVGILARS